MIMIGFLSKVQEILDTVFEEEICISVWIKPFLVFKVGVNSILYVLQHFLRVNRNSLVRIPTFSKV